MFESHYKLGTRKVDYSTAHSSHVRSVSHQPQFRQLGVLHVWCRAALYYRQFPNYARPGLDHTPSSPFLVNDQDHNCVVCTQGDRIDGPVRLIFINQSYQAFQKQPCFCQVRWANIGLSLNIHQELFLKRLLLNERHLKISQLSLQVSSTVMYFAGVCWLITILWHHEKPWWLGLCSCGEK